MVFKVLYVCQNNKGRSPALMAFSQYFSRRRGLEGVVFDSCGVSTEVIESLKKRNEGASKVSVHILDRLYDIDISDYRIKSLCETQKEADLVLATDQHTLDMIHRNFSWFGEGAALAKSYAGFKGGDMDIHGPYYYQQRFSKEKWSEILGYEIMLSETKMLQEELLNN